MTDNVPIVSLFWLGEPSKYNPDDKVLKALNFPEGDLGGRYLALPVSRAPQDLFDSTIKPFYHFYGESGRRAQMTGQITPDLVYADAICMTWIFTSQEFARMSTRLDELEDRLKKLEQENK